MKEAEIHTLREENETLRRDLQRRIQASDGELALQKQVPHTLSNRSCDIEAGILLTSLLVLFLYKKYLISKCVTEVLLN